MSDRKELYAYSGLILRVNLEKGSISKESTIDRFGDGFKGALRLGYQIMWDEVDPGTGALDPENKMVFAVGPLAATGSTNSNRMVITTKSPQSYPEMTTYSTIGGSFSMRLKKAGYDALIIEGKAERPVYLQIEDGKVEIKDASDLWGLDAWEAQEKMIKEIGQKGFQTLSIGQAGENLVRFACIMSDTYHAAGEGGFGAVMGSKNLKGIAVKGTGKVKLAEPEKFRDTVKKATKLLSVVSATPKGKTWKEGADPHDPKHKNRYNLTQTLTAKFMEHEAGDVGCGNCPNRCWSIIDAPGHPKTHMMCMNWFYSLVAKDDVEALLARDLCNQYGLNVWVLFFYIPWLNQLNKDGVINEKDSGIPFSAFPGEEYVRGLMESITFRKGLGDILAEGPPRAAKKMGVYDDLLSKEYFHFEEDSILTQLYKGHPVPFNSYGGHGYAGHWDPRDYSAQGLFWALSSRDAMSDHHEYLFLTAYSGLDYEDQKLIAKEIYGSEKAVHPLGECEYTEDVARAALLVEQRRMVKNELTLCDWAWPMIVSPFAERNPPYIGDTSLESQLFSAATGIKLNEEELRREGEKTDNLARAILIRELGVKNIRDTKDILPDHLFTCKNESTDNPPLDRDKFEDLKTFFYRLRGWDSATGLPTRETLEGLGLKEVADVLEGDGLLP